MPVPQNVQYGRISSGVLDGSEDSAVSSNASDDNSDGSTEDSDEIPMPFALPMMVMALFKLNRLRSSHAECVAS